jgi:uncharacterized repeat protein (TIGR01451 family)
MMIRTLAAILIAISPAKTLGQLVVGNDQANPTIWLLDVTGSASPRALVTGGSSSVLGLAADEAGQALYWTDGPRLYKAAYATSGLLTPMLVGSYSGGVQITGLAFDAATGTLYGRGAAGFYSIDTNTAALTLVWSGSAQDFGGFDYDAACDCFYGVNDSTSTIIVPGRGLYRILKPLSNPTFQRIALYPSGDTDIDGLAVGGGIAYLINDTPSQGIYRYSLGDNQYLLSMTSPFTGAGTSAGGAWAPGLMGTPTQADLSITLIDSPDPVIPPGANLTYTITVSNLGPSASTGVQVTQNLPGGVLFLSADPPLMHSGGVVSGLLGTLASGEQRVLNVVVQTPGIPTMLNSAASAAASTSDPVVSNNQSQQGTVVRNVQADLAVSVAGPADCEVLPGETMEFVVSLTNLGPEQAQGVELYIYLPTNAAFLGSNPPLTPQGGQLTQVIGTLDVSQQSVVRVYVQPSQGGIVNVVAGRGSITEDPVSGNNAAADPTRVPWGPAPTFAAARGILSTVPGHPTSNVPGLPGLHFVELEAPAFSESGGKWVLRARCDAPSVSDTLVVLGDASTATVVARENSFPPLPTNPAGSHTPFAIDAVVSVNDAGQWVFSGIDSRPSLNDDGFVVKWNGSSFVLVAQEGFSIPALGSQVAMSTSRGGVRITGDGRVSFACSIFGTGVSSATDEVLLGDDGATLLVRKGVTVPSAQRNGNMFAYNSLEFDNATARAPGIDAMGTRFLASARIADVADHDRVLVVDNSVVVQERVALPEFAPLRTAPGFPVAYARMSANGSWLAVGSNENNEDWVVRNGVVIARYDEDIFPGAGERWFDSTGGGTTFMIIGENRGGAVLIGGSTDDSDPLHNEVLVRHGVGVVLRENDPVDLNGDGVFTEETYIRSFVPNGATISDDGTIFALVHLRSGDAARCAGTDTDLGRALIVLPAPAACDPDVNCDGSADGFDVEAMEQAVGGDMTNFCQSDPDFNRDGSVDGFDVEAVEQVVGGASCP